MAVFHTLLSKMNEDLPIPDELYASPTDMDFDKLVNLYVKDTKEEEEEGEEKDVVFSHWNYVKMEFFAITTTIIEWYINGNISIPLFKKYLKFIEKIRQFTNIFEEMDISLLGNEKEDEFSLKEGDIEEKFPISQRGEILNQWMNFSAFLLAFERVLKSRLGSKEMWRCYKSPIYKSFVKVLDEGTLFEIELATSMLTTTQLKNPTLFMKSNYIKGGFEEAEEIDDINVRVKKLKMNDARLERLQSQKIVSKEEDLDHLTVPLEEVKEKEVSKRKGTELKVKLVIPKKKKEIVVDEVQMALNAAIVEQQKLYTKYFMESIAEEIERKVQYVGLSDCEGCSVGSLSQRDHDICMMMSFPEKFELYFDKALTLLTFENVNKVWYRRLMKEFEDFPISKAEMDRYEIAENPREKFVKLVENSEELKEYVKSVYSYFK